MPSPMTTPVPTINTPILTIPIPYSTTPAPLNFIIISSKTCNPSSNSRSNKLRDRCNSCINNKKSDCNFWKNRPENSSKKKSKKTSNSSSTRNNWPNFNKTSSKQSSNSNANSSCPTSKPNKSPNANTTRQSSPKSNRSHMNSHSGSNKFNVSLKCKTTKTSAKETFPQSTDNSKESNRKSNGKGFKRKYDKKCRRKRKSIKLESFYKGKIVTKKRSRSSNRYINRNWTRLNRSRKSHRISSDRNKEGLMLNLSPRPKFTEQVKPTWSKPIKPSVPKHYNKANSNWWIASKDSVKAPEPNTKTIWETQS